MNFSIILTRACAEVWAFFISLHQESLKLFIMNAQQALTQSSHLMDVQSQLFEVMKIKLQTPPMSVLKSALGNEDLEPLGDAHTYGIYKTTGGPALGTSGERFKPVQPVELLAAFTSCLDESAHGVNLAKLQYKERLGGSRIEFSVPLPGISFKNKAGINDRLDMFLTVSTGFDGTSTKFRLDVERPICTNGWTMINTEFSASIRSTLNAKERIAFSCEEIAKTIATTSDSEELIRALNNADLSGRQTTEFVERVFNLDTSADDISTRTQNRIDKILEAMEIEMSRTGATLWGALNGVTYYTNHVASTKWDRGDYIMLGTGAAVNKRAQQIALEYLS